MSQKEEDLPTTDAQSDNSEAPVLSGPSPGEVKKIDAVDDDHPLVRETGSESLETMTESGAGEFLSDFIYESDSAFVREWLQNHETACIRAAKLLISLSDEYPDGWLTNSITICDETGETVEDPDDFEGETRQMEVPRQNDEVISAARNLGYDPTIVWDVYTDEMTLVTEDNGIGMTPREFDKAFNTIFASGSGVDSETGGMFGVGSESSALVHGKEGGAEVETRSRRPGDHPAFRAYSYLGGANALPGAETISDTFYGTRFTMPIQESFNLSKMQSWVERFTKNLSVPVLFRKHDAGTTRVEEEYEGTKFTENYGDVPVSIERPGEFSVVAGPDTIDTGCSLDDPDTYLVSMPIDRNAGTSINTFWQEVIQFHDEQGRIIAGPNRGRYSDGQMVYPDHQKIQSLGELHPDDLVSPQPTGGRDSFQKDANTKKVFNYIEEQIKEREIQKAVEVIQRMKDADSIYEGIVGNHNDWKLFRKMVKKYGDYKVLDRFRTFKKFMDQHDSIPEFDDTDLQEMFDLFQEVEYCRYHPSRFKNKSARTEIRLGSLLSEVDPENVYMAASTGGNFVHRCRVALCNNEDAEFIVVSASKYDPWSSRFGFNILKEVPVKQSDDHDWDVPDYIHEEQKRKRSSSSLPDKVKDRALKIRADDSNSSIDYRMSISDAKERLGGSSKIGKHRNLVVIPRSSDHNISDNYDVAKYAAIASVSSKELDELKGHDSVMTFSEFKEWSQSALFATTEGTMTPKELYEDDRMVVVFYKNNNHKKARKLMSGNYDKLRRLLAEDVRDEVHWPSKLDGYDGSYRGDSNEDVDDSDKDDILFAVADKNVLKRSWWAFDQLNPKKRDIIGLHVGRNRYKPDCAGFKFHGLSKSWEHHKLIADTPNWDDDSDVYGLFGYRGDTKEQIYLALHDMGIDPTEVEADDIREMVKGQ
jgi:hypothetical protein